MIVVSKCIYCLAVCSQTILGIYQHETLFFFLVSTPPTLSLNVSTQNRDKGKRLLFMNQRVFLHTADESGVVGGVAIAHIKRWRKLFNLYISTDVCQTTNKCCNPWGALPAVTHVKLEALTFSVQVAVPHIFCTEQEKS